MKKIIVGCAFAAGVLGAGFGTARADSGRHLGQLGQECTEGVYGFDSLGAGIHQVVVDNGNFAGGVPMGLETYC